MDSWMEERRTRVQEDFPTSFERHDPSIDGWDYESKWQAISKDPVNFCPPDVESFDSFASSSKLRPDIENLFSSTSTPNTVERPDTPTPIDESYQDVEMEPLPTPSPSANPSRPTKRLPRRFFNKITPLSGRALFSPKTSSPLADPGLTYQSNNVKTPSSVSTSSCQPNSSRIEQFTLDSQSHSFDGGHTVGGLSTLDTPKTKLGHNEGEGERSEDRGGDAAEVGLKLGFDWYASPTGKDDFLQRALEQEESTQNREEDSGEDGKKLDREAVAADIGFICEKKNITEEENSEQKKEERRKGEERRRKELLGSVTAIRCQWMYDIGDDARPLACKYPFRFFYQARPHVQRHADNNTVETERGKVIFCQWRGCTSSVDKAEYIRHYFNAHVAPLLFGEHSLLRP
ncbi:hypothetical protein GYMLUDRAFT_693238 [Collybiopsis luxurians FD-317 M1]|uniref:Unplaced genomic scaffold GYMLUscaffold_36, whole genome shotgun sequence n=1 Tax=Collybiopsis luxurians FD-317 M1 TaxID=944289 RepID=A0A0D0B5J3_9AGAR|nr:hypothetical protein GYMLUDRAFT_693238 [Collybiopsis luxurians FD-317 M1]